MMIVVDWGTTNLRAYRCSADGAILERRSSPRGVKSLSRGDYPEVLQELLDSFAPESGQQVFISGMAGSRNGWVEVPYCSLPADLDALKANLHPLPPPFNGYLIPGVRVVKDDGTSDVMRGEEIQVFGALHSLDLSSALLCLPGTHSKWVRAQDRQLCDFSTFMTGDLFQGLGQTILGCDSETAFSSEAFAKGLDAVNLVAGGLLHQLFTGRTLMLDGKITVEEVSSFVSGLLLGHELKQALTMRDEKERVVLIGAEALCARYRSALNRQGVEATILSSDLATCAGVAALPQSS
ncbi:2-dehydro-3-deoxygalactonokinase [Pelobacter seleniigenes]|uniref:2-dehydro-3-deoxygalactonokinase n=1 Tax=Pelobacter seleniigenes TaxID=407188 RepID=UPI0004A71F49|nr:2-dehydro-3-deoxygalactonokinase [Pelobacter seleniigenes]